jgi:hypothetical protein
MLVSAALPRVIPPSFGVMIRGSFRRCPGHRRDGNIPGFDPGDVNSRNRPSAAFGPLRKRSNISLTRIIGEK